MHGFTLRNVDNVTCVAFAFHLRSIVDWQETVNKF